MIQMSNKTPTEKAAETMTAAAEKMTASVDSFTEIMKKSVQQQSDHINYTEHPTEQIVRVLERLDYDLVHDEGSAFCDERYRSVCNYLGGIEKGIDNIAYSLSVIANLFQSMGTDKAGTPCINVVTELMDPPDYARDIERIADSLDPDGSDESIAYHVQCIHAALDDDDHSVLMAVDDIRDHITGEEDKPDD